MAFLNKWLKSASTDWLHGPVPGTERTQIKSDQHYIKVRVESMRLQYSRIGFTNFHAVVHCYFSYMHDEAGRVSMRNITSPANLQKLDKKGIQNVLQLGETVLGPIPYRAAELELEIGLFAVMSDDISDSFLKFVTEVSNLGGVSFVKAALPVLDLVKSGVDLLLGTDKATSLLVGVAQGISDPHTGTYMLIASDKSNFTQDDFRIDPTDGRLIRNEKPFEEADYIVYSISSDTTRSNWAEIPDLKNAYNALLEKIKNGVEQNAKPALEAFRLACVTSPDLLLEDQDRLYEKGKQVYDRAFPAGPTTENSIDRSLYPEFANLELYR